MFTPVLPLSAIMNALRAIDAPPQDAFLPVSDADLQDHHIMVVVARSSGGPLYGLCTTDTVERLMENYKTVVVRKNYDDTRKIFDPKGVALGSHSVNMEWEFKTFEEKLLKAFAAYNQADAAKKEELADNVCKQQTDAIISNFVYIGPPNTYDLEALAVHTLFMEARMAELETKNAELEAALEAARVTAGNLADIQKQFERGAESVAKIRQYVCEAGLEPTTDVVGGQLLGKRQRTGASAGQEQRCRSPSPDAAGAPYAPSSQSPDPDPRPPLVLNQEVTLNDLIAIDENAIPHARGTVIETSEGGDEGIMRIWVERRYADIRITKRDVY